MRTEPRAGLAHVPPPPVSRQISVRAHELAPRIGELEANLHMIEEAIRDAAKAGVQMLVLPELATSGYYLRVDEAKRCALPADDPVFGKWASLLDPGMVLVLGFCERDGDTLFNSAAVITQAGVIAVYRKTHLWDEEQSIFEPGSAPAPIVQTPLGNLGVLICYDLEFPEMPRGLALRGAEIIAVSTNWPTVSRPEGEHPPEVIQAMAAARSSRVAIVCCDRAGTERGNLWTQGSSVINGDGWLSGKRDGDRLDATITIAPGRTQIGPRNDSINDRRPAIYVPSGNVSQG
ncbi:putative amidohydrolase [Arthrobacter sp. 1088]|uniref:nitrilase-related carbon-nitrogen hydrolase n=1 Tax=Arthrobacter sp. 1088 TaxID=2817768 RepID=UPI00285EC69F|nr:nitrilase-related carbon-nitrogen hydrolase [Arthrobacter sp. 1088]MDR6687733.1 putative amidohydrolase [Arthrobacter sp. 1088]